MTGTQSLWQHPAVTCALFLLAYGLVFLFLTMCGSTALRWFIRFVRDAWRSDPEPDE